MTSRAVLQSKLLRPSKTPEEYRLYRAGLEWDLTDPIVIETKEDIKSSVRWSETVEPFNHQVSNLMNFCRRLPVTLLADDVGLGKTISAGLIMSELIARSRLTKTLIVCPKILGPQWKEELETKFAIPASVVTGKGLLETDPDGVGAVITTYQTARNYLEKLPRDRFGMLVLDEAHKLRNLYGTQKAPQVAKCFHKALSDRRFAFVLMLTATPIQNRLWDLYSLVDLLTVARGHDNPFGSQGMFARKFIAGDKEQARHLKPEAAEQFRNIVYGYMSRVRRGDAKLYFPTREVQLHRVDPTPAELELIQLVAAGIEGMNRLAQISILQALTSSPDALSAQLENMARNRTVDANFAADVKAVVKTMPPSAKLNGLAVLIRQLKQDNADQWRLVIFTTRRETQTTIVNFLEGERLSVGVINGTSGSRNQETLQAFRASPPALRVIVSTEAGSEGVNLQVANVLVNYDLPWNPMIVEQRVGRVQRLGSAYDKVSIFNITLKGTFEEYIVARLLEKLQMSTTAIGDIESLLQGTVESEEGAEGFEEQIRRLVVAALKGADVEGAVRQKEESIAAAKRALVEEEKQINDFLGGGMGGDGYVGPKAPSLPKVEHSMPITAFAQGAWAWLKANVTPLDDGRFLVEDESGRETIGFDPTDHSGASLYAPGTSGFTRLVQRITASGLHGVVDHDQEPQSKARALAGSWAEDFGGQLASSDVFEAQRRFTGTVALRVRATVAHDSYERLVEVDCADFDRRPQLSLRGALQPLPPNVEDAARTLGLSPDQLTEAAARDPGIAEFCRFYLERRAQEVAAAAEDERKRQKLMEDFTPRLAVTLVGAGGGVSRRLKLLVTYRVGEDGPFKDELVLTPSAGSLDVPPPMGTCAVSQRQLPQSCLDRCAISGKLAFRPALLISETSHRRALPEHTVRCETSGRLLLDDEVGRSDVTGRLIAKELLQASDVSGRKGESEHFGRCNFTNSFALRSELAKSDVSGKPYRQDETARSVVSVRAGHRDEFVTCSETQSLLCRDEAEKCSITSKWVRHGLLVECEETGTRALPSEIEACAVSGRRVLKRLLVTSSVSSVQLLEKAAVRSAFGLFCAPVEARACVWGDRKVHPADIRTCALTGIDIHFEYATAADPPRLDPLVRMLDGVKRGTDRPELWEPAATLGTGLLGKAKCRIDAAISSPGQRHLAMVSDVKTMLGLKTRQAGFVFSAADNQIVGRVAIGKRGTDGWRAA